MKTLVKCLGIVIFTIMFIFALIGCEEPNSLDSVINIAVIRGVTAPAVGRTPIIEITPTTQYTGTVVWSPDHNTFQSLTTYSAKITLIPKKGYILKGVTKNFFKIPGANNVYNDADSGVITAVFLKTPGTIDNSTTIDIQDIEGITAPLIGGIPKTEIYITEQYTGTVTWSPADSTFKSSTIYTATITLTPNDGFTFIGIAANFFTVAGANTVSNEANSGVITAVFNETNVYNIDGFMSYLGDQPDNTAATPYSITLNIGNDDFGKLKTTLIDFPNKYVNLDLSNNTIPDSFTSIIMGAFQNCTNLTSVNIPDGITSIESQAFSGCTSLKSVYIPNSVTNIKIATFEGCTNLTNVTIPDGVTSIWNLAFSGCTSLTSVYIPNSVTSMGGYAFRDCTSLASVTIQDGVTSIGSQAFYCCTSLTSVYIPSSVTSIEGDAFYGCTSLTSINIPDIKEIADFT